MYGGQLARVHSSIQTRAVSFESHFYHGLVVCRSFFFTYKNEHLHIPLYYSFSPGPEKPRLKTNLKDSMRTLGPSFACMVD